MNPRISAGIHIHHRRPTFHPVAGPNSIVYIKNASGTAVNHSDGRTRWTVMIPRLRRHPKHTRTSTSAAAFLAAHASFLFLLRKTVSGTFAMVLCHSQKFSKE